MIITTTFAHSVAILIDLPKSLSLCELLEEVVEGLLLLLLLLLLSDALFLEGSMSLLSSLMVGICFNGIALFIEDAIETSFKLFLLPCSIDFRISELVRMRPVPPSLIKVPSLLKVCERRRLD